MEMKVTFINPNTPGETLALLFSAVHPELRGWFRKAFVESQKDATDKEQGGAAL